MLGPIAVLVALGVANAGYLGNGCGGYGLCGGFGGFGYGAAAGAGYGIGYGYGLGFAGIGYGRGFGAYGAAPGLLADITTTGQAAANDALQIGRTQHINAATRASENARADMVIASINKQSAINSRAAHSNAFFANAAYAARTHQIGQQQAIANRGIQISRNHADGARIHSGALAASAAANAQASAAYPTGSANFASVVAANNAAHGSAMALQSGVFARGAAGAHASPFGGFGGFGGAGWGAPAPAAYSYGVNGAGPKGFGYGIGSPAYYGGAYGGAYGAGYGYGAFGGAGYGYGAYGAGFGGYGAGFGGYGAGFGYGAGYGAGFGLGYGFYKK